jgi:hypothetical protein
VAIDKTRKKMGVSVIARDHEGKVLATLCSSKPYITNPIVADAIFAWKAVEFGKDLGIQNIILEGNALDIVHALLKEEQFWSRYGNLLNNSKTLLNSLQSWYVNHV